VATIQAEQAALADAQRSAGAVASACTGASGTVSAMSGLAGSALAGCDIVAAAWSTFAAATSGYVSAFGEAAGILGGKIGSAAQAYAATDNTVGSGMRAQ
jgi:hypothetical protein